jgi:hypothetical protein
VTTASVESVLLDGIATWLAANGYGTYSASGAYPDDVDTPIEFKVMRDTPDRAIVLTAYRISAQPGFSLDRYRLQVRTRGVRDDALDVDELAGPIAGFLHGATYLAFGGCVIDQILHYSSIPMGPDDTGRHERSDNFDLDVDVPATAHRPA